MKVLCLLLILQICASCASYHHVRFPSSEDIEREEFIRRNPRLRNR